MKMKDNSVELNVFIVSIKLKNINMSLIRDSTNVLMAAFIV